MVDAILKQAGIYCIRNTVNGKVYVGSAVCLSSRWRSHKSELKRNKHHSFALQRAFDKYGISVFQFEILEKIINKNELIVREQYWINELKAFGRNGYNMSPNAGNCLGRKFSDATKAKMSASAMGRVVSEETRQKISASQKLVSAEIRAKTAKKHLGRKNTAETIKKMSFAQTGKKHSAETKAKLSVITSNMSQEHRDKIAASLRGRKGKPHTAESIAKMALAKIGHEVTQETRQKISDSLRKRAKNELQG